MTNYSRLRTPGAIDSVVSSTEYLAAILVDNPIAVWPLAGASTTESVSGRSISFNGTPTSTTGPPTTPSIATATAFAGAFSQYGNVAANPVFGPSGDITWEAWVLRASGSAGVSVCGASPNSGNPCAWGIDTQGAGSSNKWRGFITDSAGNPYVAAADTSTITLGTWYHLAVTLLGTTLTLYVNGAPVSTSGPSGTRYAPGSVPVQIARYNSTFTQYFTGSIAYLAFYGAALSAARVASHYAAV